MKRWHVVVRYHGEPVAAVDVEAETLSAARKKVIDSLPESMREKFLEVEIQEL